jgi:tRNA G37 N-methylase TrmD
VLLPSTARSEKCSNCSKASDRSLSGAGGRACVQMAILEHSLQSVTLSRSHLFTVRLHPQGVSLSSAQAHALVACEQFWAVDATDSGGSGDGGRAFVQMAIVEHSLQSVTLSRSHLFTVRLHPQAVSSSSAQAHALVASEQFWAVDPTNRKASQGSARIRTMGRPLGGHACARMRRTGWQEHEERKGNVDGWF